MASSGQFRESESALGSADLVGCWHQLRDPGAPVGDSDVEMEFTADGRLTYSVGARGRWQIVRLVYRLDGDAIVTDQPSAPREERTPFRLESDGTLVLTRGTSVTRYRRGDRRAPAV